MVRGVLDSYNIKFVQTRTLCQKFGICSAQYNNYIQVKHGDEFKSVLREYKTKQKRIKTLLFFCCVIILDLQKVGVKCRI